jgi:hypothetical protein
MLLISVVVTFAACCAAAEVSPIRGNDPFSAAIAEAIERVPPDARDGVRLELEAPTGNWKELAVFAQVRDLVEERCAGCESVRIESGSAAGPYSVTWILFQDEAGIAFSNRRNQGVIDAVPLNLADTRRARSIQEELEEAFGLCASDPTVTDAAVHVVTSRQGGNERSHAVYGLLRGSAAYLQPKPELVACRAVVDDLIALGSRQESDKTP